MLSEDEKSLIRDCIDSMRSQIDGFRTRRPQLHMVATIANALAACVDQAAVNDHGRNIAVIEAGTGTGKTFGALIPALVMARSRGKKLVVSSSTVALQQQYVSKDCPTLQEVLPIGFKVAEAKGRKRYACPAKLAGEGLQLDVGAGESKAEVDAAASERLAEVRKANEQRHIIKVLGRLAESLEDGSWNGDRDELRIPMNDDLWGMASTDRQGCTGKQCAYFAKCPFYSAKQKVRDADLIIANHDLVLSALTMDAGSVLPAPEKTMFVFDEAHSLANKVIERFSEKHALLGGREWLEGAVNCTRDAAIAMGLDKKFVRDAMTNAAVIDRALADLHKALSETRAFEEKKTRRFKGSLPEWAVRAGRQIHEHAVEIQKTFTALRSELLERAASEGSLVTQLLVKLGFFVGKVDNLVSTWDLLLSKDEDHEAPIARWVESTVRKGDGTQDFLMCASPISGSEKLRRLLWDKASAVVLMSATLTSCGTFDLFLRQAGLSKLKAINFLQVESPFDYRSKAKLSIPAMASDPTDAAAHTAEVAARMEGLIVTNGTLVIFASAKQMRDVYGLISPELQKLVLMQGTLPKGELLSRHRAAVDQGQRSVVFGLQSLAEGVDLPRDYCTHVVCAKLPFGVPDTPMEEARREWIESEGGSAFMEVTLPETAVRLKQLLGRLLRTVDDWGTATILDRRIVTKRWGEMLMKGLPDFDVRIEQAQAQTQMSSTVRRAPSPASADLKYRAAA